MKCDNCEYEYSIVVETEKKRYAKEDKIYRRRECTECGFRWTTWETKQQN